MRSRIALLSVVLLLAGGTPLASAAEINHPGVIDVDWASDTGGAEPKAKIELSGPVLRLMTAATGRAARFGELVDQLKLVRVEVYEDLEAGINLYPAIQQRVEELKQGGWQGIVRVRDGDQESVDVLVLPNGEEQIAGIAVLVAEEDELVFVNIAGWIEAEAFGEKFGRILGPLLEGELDLEDLLEVDEEDEEEDWHDHDEDHDHDHDEDHDGDHDHED